MKPSLSVRFPWLMVLTMVLGTGGGALFAWLHLPLPWMLGAMSATTVAALSGIRLYMPFSLRMAMVAVLGVLLGSAFTPDILDQIGRWLPTALLLGLYIPLSLIVVYIYFRRLWGYDVPTAYFSASPGGLTAMILTGEAMGGDGRKIALVHATRILIVVLLIPVSFRLWGGFNVQRAAFSLGHYPPVEDILLLLAAIPAGWGVAGFLRLPTPALLGPLIASIAIHISGLTAARPPFEIVAISQIVVGAGIGTRFSGSSLRHAGRTIVAATGSTVLMLALVALFASLGTNLFDLGAPGLILSLAPGGLTEMSLIALAMGIDTAMVSTMHILRIFTVLFGAPVVFQALRLKERFSRRG